MTIRETIPSDHENPNYLTIATDEIDDVAVLRLGGGFAGEAAANGVLNDLVDYIVPPYKKLLLNLAQVTETDLLAVRTIVQLSDIARDKGGQMAISSPAARLAERLGYLEKGSAIPLFRTEDDALEAFRSLKDTRDNPDLVLARHATRSLFPGKPN